MKRVSFLENDKKKRATEMVREMESIEIEHQRVKLNKILTERKNKLKDLIYKKEINLPNMNYLPKSGKSFSFIESNASKEPFIPQKMRRRKFEPDRVFSSSPNMKVGSPKSVKIQQEAEDKLILNKKFMEYDRIFSNKPQLNKMDAIKKLSESLKYEYPRRKNADFKKTYFQKVFLDKYNFYITNQYSSIRSSMLANSKTDKKGMKSHEYVLSQLKSASTLDTSIREYPRLGQSSLNKLRTDTKNFSSALQKSNIRRRIKTQGSDILPVSFQKDLNNY